MGWVSAHVVLLLRVTGMDECYRCGVLWRVTEEG